MTALTTAETWFHRLGLGSSAAADAPVGAIPAAHQVQQGFWVTGEERWVAGRTTRLFTFAHGCRDRDRTVLCIPPLATTGRIFAPLAPLSRDHRLLLWTPPASRRGRSACQEDVSLLSEPDFPLPERFALVAASHGCRTALALAARCPARIRALVLIAPLLSPRQVRRFGPLAAGLVGLPRPSARLLAPLGFEAIRGRRLPLPATLELLRQARRFQVTDVLRRLRQGAQEALPDWSRLRGLPTLALFGGLDPFADLRALAPLARDLGWATERIDDASHLPFLSHPVCVNARLQTFLAERH